MAQTNTTLTINSFDGKMGGMSFARSSSATRVNNVGHVETVGSDVIRYDHHTEPTMIGIHKGYLLEEQSENTALQSSDFGTTWTVTAASQTNLGAVTTNTTDFMSPSGAFDADELSCDTSGTGIVAVRQVGMTYTDGEKYTISVWAKKPSTNGYDYLEIGNLDAAGAGMTASKCYNLSTGAVGTASGGSVDASSMTAYAGGWYRCTLSFTGSSSQGEIYFKARTDDAVNSETAHTAGERMYLWGAQVENKAYATSYIPTTTAAVSRAADVASVANTDAMWNWNAGMSLWVDYIPMNTTAPVTPVYHYSDTSNQNYVTLLSDGKLKVSTAGNSQLDSNPFDTGAGFVADTCYRTVVAMQVNDLHYASNGTLSANLPDTTINVPMKSDSSNYDITLMHGTGYSSGSGWIKGFRIYPQRVSNVDMQNITVPVKNTINTLHIAPGGTVADNTIGEAHLMANSVTTTKIADGAVTEAKIGSGAVTQDKLGIDSVGTAAIINGSVTEAELADNSVTSAKIAFDVIVAEDIQANAITVAELADNAVAEAKIVDGAVTNAKLGADAVDGTKIADDAVDSEHLAAGGIDSEHIANDAVDSQHYAAGSIDLEHMSANSVDSDQYVDGSIDTAHLGDLQVTEAKIADGVVTNAKFANDSIDHTKIQDDAVRTEHIVDSHITTAKINNGAVDGTKIANDSITSAHIAPGVVIETDVADNAITAAKLADDAVDTNAIQDGAITNAKLGAGSITSDKIALDIIVAEDIANNAVTMAELQDGAVTGTKIELTGNVEGDIMYYDSNGDWVVLHPVAGAYLQSNGSGAAPSWASSATMAIALS